MARNDANPLPVPDSLPSLAAAQKKEAEEQRRRAEEELHKAAEQAAQQLKQLQKCPHCGAKLSAIDKKMERCFGCGKSLITHSPAPSDTAPAGNSFVVRYHY